MSWDYNEYDKPCSCGKGLISVVEGSNDWGQTSYVETILCDECREKAEKKEALKQERNRKASNQIFNTMSLFREHYLDLWKSKFNGTKTKKDLWLVATNLGIKTSNIGIFYKNFKTRDEYIDRLFSWGNIQDIKKTLDIDDHNLDKLYNEAFKIYKEMEDERLVEANLHFKGR